LAPAINRKKLADSVIEEIRTRLNAGELKVGDKLPNQHDFAAQLGVSRTVLREALHTLALLGVIEQRPKLGTIIRDRVPVFYADQLTWPVMSDAGNTIKLIEARRLIEVGAVELAARNAAEEQIAEMGALVEDMTRLARNGDIEAYTERNVAFHFLMAQASQNHYLVHFLTTLQGVMKEWMRESVSVLPGLLESSARSHRLIFEAVRDRDRRRAAAGMRKHILDLQKSIEQYHKLAVESGQTSEGGPAPDNRLSR